MYETISNEAKAKYFKLEAKRFEMEAKMLRCNAAVHVEDKADIILWSNIFNHFRPNLRLHFISSSRNEYGHKTTGVTQCLKYIPYLSENFFICIDSDYRYLTGDKTTTIKNNVFQTYTYSIENHYCYSDKLIDVCQSILRFKPNIFNFNEFYIHFSKIIYPLLIWHLYFIGGNNAAIFSKYDFNGFLKILEKKTRNITQDNGYKILSELQIRVKRKIRRFQKRYPKADIDFIKNNCKKLGLQPENTYLFLRGHNIYDMTKYICLEVCRMSIINNKKNINARKSINKLYQNFKTIENQLKKTIRFDEYMHIIKIKEDIDYFLPIKPKT